MVAELLLTWLLCDLPRRELLLVALANESLFFME